jgi:type II secretory pathway pseudopilin PulG
MWPKHKLQNQAGYSMVELLVSLGMTIVISAASFALFGSSMKFANATYHITDAEQSLRNAHEVMNRDLTTAGDGLRGIGTITAPLTFVNTFLTRTPVTCGNDPNYPCIGIVTSDDSIPAGTAVPKASTPINFQANSDRISMLTRDTDFNNGNAVSVLAGKITISGSNTLINVGSANIGLFQANEIYAVVSQNSAAFGVVTGVDSGTFVLTMANNDGGFGLNQTTSTAPISVVSGISSGTPQNVSIMRYQIIQYFVDANGLLIRRVFGVRGSSFLDSVVAEHITNLQFRYLTNLTDPNGFVKQPTRVLASSTEQSALREVETAIGVETARAVNAVTNVNSSSNACGSSPNGKQSICSTTATTVRNLQFRQALSP